MWDSALWLDKINEAQRLHSTKGVRVEVYTSTRNIIEKGSYLTDTGNIVNLCEILTPDIASKSVFYFKELPKISCESRHKTIFSVRQEDCLATASELLTEDPTNDVCVLNMASGSMPGGGVLNGSGAQEEYLFRCSDYYRSLYQYANSRYLDSKDFGIVPHPSCRYPLDKNFGGIYSPSVTVFRDDEAHGYALVEHPWKVNMVAVPAVNLNRFRPTQDEYTKTMKNKIRTILRIAYNNNQRRLVLSAFGCGAFRNDPNVVATFFKDVLMESEFEGVFREIHFSIIENHNSQGRNVTAFQKVFD